MHLSNIAPLLASLVGSAVGTFVVAVLVDDALGIILAIKHRAFDPKALPSFLESQFGTKAAVALAGLIVTAVLAGRGDVKTAALAAATAGAAAMTASVAADIKDKLRQIAGL